MKPADLWVIGIYCLAVLILSLYLSRRAGQSVESYFLGERKLTWWMIGIADVTGFGTAPVVYVMFLFTGGFAPYWLNGWLAWCVWMPLVTIVWAKMWRRLGVTTTGEFIENRYGGPFAACYRSIFAGYTFFVISMTSLAYGGAFFIQTVGPILGWESHKILLVFGTVLVLYTMLAGLVGIVYTDILQCIVVFGGGIFFMLLLMGHAGGFTEMYEKAITARSSGFFKPYPPYPEPFYPKGNSLSVLTMSLLIFQGFFFAGHPYAGEGSIVQKFMAAKDERHAILGQIFNLFLSLVVRLIPAMFIGVALIVLYPQTKVATPMAIWATAVRDFAPHGMLGFLFAGAIAAYMAGAATSLNWGSSYFVNDVYRRHLRPHASQKEYVLVGRLLAIVTLTIAYSISLSIDPQKIKPWILFINSIVAVFAMPLSWLKWFWWRMNVFGDAVGVLAGFPIGIFVWFGSDNILPKGFRSWVHAHLGWNMDGLIPRFSDLEYWKGFTILFLLGWSIILLVTLLTRPESPETLRKFYLKVRPIGWWGPFAKELPPDEYARLRAETRQSLQACLVGVIFTFAMCIDFFAFIGAWYRLFALLLPIVFIFGYLFFKLTLKSFQFLPTEAGVEAESSQSQTARLAR